MNFDIELPEWAKYVAQDADGEWFAYNVRPSPDCKSWWSSEPTLNHHFIVATKPPEDFTKTLRDVIA